MTEITLHVEERQARDGIFIGWVDVLGCIVHSRQPFLDAARALLKFGFPPGTILQMITSTGVKSLRGPIGKVAKFTVKDNDQGRGPRFIPYRAFVPRKPKDAINSSPPTPITPTTK